MRVKKRNDLRYRESAGGTMIEVTGGSDEGHAMRENVAIEEIKTRPGGGPGRKQVLGRCS